MMVHTITSLDIPGLLPYRTLRRPADQYEQGLFVAEGSKVVSRLLASALNVRSVLLTDEWYERERVRLERLMPVPEVFVGTKGLLEKIVGFHLHQGIMALAEIPPQPSFGDLMQDHATPVLLVALDGLTNSENVGIIVRNARAFGATAVLVGETSSSPYLRRAVRNSLGTVFMIPVVHVGDLAAQLHSLTADYKISVLAAETGKGGIPIDTLDLTGDVCLVVGGEDAGIRDGVLNECTAVIEVPMDQGVDSLNVANATAVCLYEVRRQRRLQASR